MNLWCENKEKQKERLTKYFLNGYFSDDLLSCLIFLTNNGIQLPKIENRDAVDSFTYDGNSLALKQGSLKLLDHDILHEIGHYIFTSDLEQRIYPEYALNIGIVCPEALGIPGIDGLRDKNGKTFGYLNLNTRILDGFMDDWEGFAQEKCAQLFSIVMGRKFGIDSHLLEYGLDEESDNWNEYQKVKFGIPLTLPECLSVDSIGDRFERLDIRHLLKELA